MRLDKSAQARPSVNITFHLSWRYTSGAPGYIERLRFSTMPLLSRWPIPRCKLKKGATIPLFLCIGNQSIYYIAGRLTEFVVLGELRDTNVIVWGAGPFTRCGDRECLLPPLPPLSPRFLYRAQRDILRNANAIQSLGAGCMGYITFPGFPHCDRIASRPARLL